MTREDVQRWLDDYVEAWRTYEPARIEALFSAAARYRFQPWAEPVEGRERIVASWLTNRDEPDSWQAEYRPLVVDGAVAVAEGWTSYRDHQDQGPRTYHNIFVLRFDAEGRCAEFTEYYMERPAGTSGGSD
ncbi:MAG TPA: nuclear transport factor 2 family protein [Candidatus Limnocylindrales bacterium]|nr:nuclear transport factor 2 family protein [Candidatus Limnocylindrales bacterium]